MGNTTLREIQDELRSLLEGRAGIVDGIVAPIVFVVTNAIAGMPAAAYAGVAVAVTVVVVRLARRNDLRYAVSGLFGTGLAIALALRSGDAQDYFLPGIISGVATTVIAVVSVAVRRPMVAYMSWVARQWPLDWYWHPGVRPAYARVTWLWAGFFAVRTGVQIWLFLTDQTTALGFVRAATGWPGTIALLIATFVVGRNRLLELGGPSVDQFESNAPRAEWQPQPSGF